MLWSKFHRSKFNIIGCLSFALILLFTIPLSAQDDEITVTDTGESESKITIEGKDVELLDVNGSSYVTLEQLSKSLGLSVKYFPESKMYKISKNGQDIKFVLNKRAVVVGDKYYKSNNPITKTDDGVLVPAEVISEIFEVNKTASGKKHSKEAAEAEEIIVDDDSDETNSVNIVVNNTEKDTAETSAITGTSEAAVTNAPVIENTKLTEDTKSVEIENQAVIENVKYRRNKNSFELDLIFDKQLPLDMVNYNLNPDKTNIDIQISKVDSKLGDQTIKIPENIIKDVKLALIPGAKSNKVILSLTSSKAVAVSSVPKGNVITFVLTGNDNMLAPIISEENKTGGTSENAITGTAEKKLDILKPADILKNTNEAAITKKDNKLPEDKTKNPVSANIKDSAKLIEGIENIDYIIAVDAGHGGEEFGTISENRLNEKDVTLDIARRLKSIIDKTKMRCLLVRNGDYFMPSENRLKSINSYNTQIHISLHAGSSTSPQANGVSIFYYDISGGVNSHAEDKMLENKSAGGAIPANVENQVNEILNSLDISKKTTISKNLAEKITESIRKNKNIKIRKLKGTMVSGLSDCMMPSVMIEVGFLSNRDDEKNLTTNEYKDELALAIFNGIKDYITKK
ncbi:MAG: N-acetylmuramoyl-L-alanine amidase [Candidatus Wallbacteria bacterium]